MGLQFLKEFFESYQHDLPLFRKVVGNPCSLLTDVHDQILFDQHQSPTPRSSNYFSSNSPSLQGLIEGFAWVEILKGLAYEQYLEKLSQHPSWSVLSKKHQGLLGLKKKRKENLKFLNLYHAGLKHELLTQQI